MKTIIVIEGKLREEGTENRRISRKLPERKKIIDSAPALAYVV
jgi:hypothetical protein